MATPYDARRMDADRRAKGWTFAKLAQRAKLHPARVSKFFKGSRQTPDTAAALAKALGHDLARYVPDLVVESQLAAGARS